MEKELVRSSNIHSVGYDQATTTLEIEFRTGGVYQYLMVPDSVYHGLMRASSKGRYFHDHIREKYRTRRLR
jgi:hypothetical protein